MGQAGGRWKVGTVLFILVVCCVIIGIVVWQTTKTKNKTPDQQSSAGQQTQSSQSFNLGILNISTKDLSLRVRKQENYVLVGQLGIGEQSGSFENCSDNYGGDSICLVWKNDTRLHIQRKREQETECFTITWEVLTCVDHVLQDCFEVGKAHWYGGYEDWYQYWPFEKTTRNLSAYITNDSYQKGIGGVQERYFFSTQGVVIYVEEDVPLYLSFNASADGNICLVSKYEKYPFQNAQKKLPQLKYHVCVDQNVKTIHEYASKRFIQRPTGIPDPKLFRYPIWSTWAQYHKDINQSIVLDYAKNILDYGFPHSQIEIDDDWTPKYGDMDFNTAKFPDPKEMINELTDLGFRVTVWLHPFFNIDSQAFTEAKTNKYLIRQLDSEIPALVSWWDGDAAGILDTSNEEAIEWYLNKTDYLRQTYNISSFKFDAGETAWLPNAYSSANSLDVPNIYTKKWAELAYRSDPDIRHQEVRVGFKSQNLPIFVRMLDKDTNWDYTNGLKTLIPTALTLEYSFSIVPWQFDEETINITRNFLELHENYTDLIIDLANQSTTTGAPIIRPLWWIDPEDEDAQVIDSEFLLGDTILVAPILDDGARQRDIYLPKGKWMDMLYNNVTDGPQWLTGYPADLHELPYFKIVT
ncbi:hypothetical protein FSP39_002944 [Pinctada imbricata]|uniref:Myogenesis-regulating glycosidase n=1 Tax=Pinctada imbricata TaxID=66713 RepID=A0AA89BYB6_PINIB|nr:hypothetical protein FSP39_002944 [Pinctada imbricata]